MDIICDKLLINIDSSISLCQKNKIKSYKVMQVQRKSMGQDIPEGLKAEMWLTKYVQASTNTGNTNTTNNIII